MVEEFPEWGDEPETEEEDESEDEEEVPAAIEEKTTEEVIDELFEEEAEEEKKPSGAAVAGAIALTPLILVFAALMLAFSLMLSAVPGAAGTPFALAASYLTNYSLSSMQYIPDVLMVLGAGIACLGIALFFVSWAVRIVVFGVQFTYTLLSKIYGKLLGKEPVEHE